MKVKPIKEVRYIFDKATMCKSLDRQIYMSDTNPEAWYNVYDQKCVGTDRNHLRVGSYGFLPSWCKEEIVYQDDERYYFDKELLFADVPEQCIPEEKMNPDMWFNEYDGYEVIFDGLLRVEGGLYIGHPIKNGRIVGDISIVSDWVKCKIKSVE